jgi:hypothetical protein
MLTLAPNAFGVHITEAAGVWAAFAGSSPDGARVNGGESGITPRYLPTIDNQ